MMSTFDCFQHNKDIGAFANILCDLEKADGIEYILNGAYTTLINNK